MRMEVRPVRLQEVKGKGLYKATSSQDHSPSMARLC